MIRISVPSMILGGVMIIAGGILRPYEALVEEYVKCNGLRAPASVSSILPGHTTALLQSSATYQAQIREEADAEAIKERNEHKIKIGQRAEATGASISYYPVNKDKDADIVSNLSPSSLIRFLNRQRDYAYTSVPLESLPAGAQVTPFFFNNEARDVATADFRGEKCAIASLDDHVVFIPLADYNAAGLPMR